MAHHGHDAMHGDAAPFTPALGGFLPASSLLILNFNLNHGHRFGLGVGTPLKGVIYFNWFLNFMLLQSDPDSRRVKVPTLSDRRSWVSS